MKTHYAMLLAVLLLIRCAFAPSASAGGEAIVIDDKAVYSRLLRSSLRLHKEGKAVPIAEIRSQLGRRECKLELSAASTRRMTPDRIYATYLPSILVLGGPFKCDKCAHWHVSVAAGFLITSSGAFVTNYHVVGTGKQATLVALTYDGAVFPVKEVLAASKGDDVAILQLDAGGRELRPLALSTDAPVGAPVTVISHPANRFYTLARGVVSRRFVSSEKDCPPVPRVSITADFARGASGGPVFNECGAVVGIVRSTGSIYHDVSKNKKENLQMVLKECVPASQALKLIKEP